MITTGQPSAGDAAASKANTGNGNIGSTGSGHTGRGAISGGGNNHVVRMHSVAARFGCSQVAGAITWFGCTARDPDALPASVQLARHRERQQLGGTVSSDDRDPNAIVKPALGGRHRVYGKRSSACGARSDRAQGP